MRNGHFPGGLRVAGRQENQKSGRLSSLRAHLPFQGGWIWGNKHRCVSRKKANWPLVFPKNTVTPMSGRVAKHLPTEPETSERGSLSGFYVDRVNVGLGRLLQIRLCVETRGPMRKHLTKSQNTVSPKKTMKQSSSWFVSSSLVAAWTSPICSFAGCFDKRALPGRERPALPEYALIPTRNQGTNKNRCRGSSFGRHLPLTQVGLCSDGQLVGRTHRRIGFATRSERSPVFGCIQKHRSKRSSDSVKVQKKHGPMLYPLRNPVSVKQLVGDVETESPFWCLLFLGSHPTKGKKIATEQRRVPSP